VYSQAGQYLFEEPDLITDASFTVGQSKQGKPSTRYQYLGNMLIAKSSGTQTTYLHTDHLGSPIAESSVGPTVEVTHLPLHEPYGAPSNGTYLDGPGYTGHVVDGLTGLSYMQARYYDPVAGRFLGVDPVGVDLGSGGNGRACDSLSGGGCGQNILGETTVERSTTAAVIWGVVFAIPVAIVGVEVGLAALSNPAAATPGASEVGGQAVIKCTVTNSSC
jgi:RHS repeat-associated protein